MTAYELTCLLTIVIIFYRALINLFIFLQHRTANFLFFFALTEVLFGLYLLFVLQTINVEPRTALLFERLENATIPLIAVFFMIFAQKLDPLFPPGVLLALIVANCVAALIILIMPGAYHEGLQAPKSFPALGITFYETRQPLWVAMFLFFNFGLLLRVLWRFMSSREGLFFGSRVFLAALVILALGFLHDIMISLQVIYSPYLGHFGFLLMMFSMEFIVQSRAKAEPDPGAGEASVQPIARLPSTGVEPTAAPRGPAARAGVPVQAKYARINCLGPLEIFVEGEAIRFAEIARKRKLLKLFKLLLVHYGRGLHREAAIEALWPELSEANAYNNLHALCFRLRKFFRKPEVIVLTEEQLYLEPELVETDFALFETALDQGLAAYNKKDFERAVATIEGAVSLYRGPFFEFDPYFEPAAAARDSLSIKYRKTLQALCEIYYGRGDFAQVLEYSRIAIDMDDLDEGSWRFLFRGLHLTGRKNEALKKFEELKKRLKHELDVEVDEATERLMRSIKADERDPAKL